MISILILLCIWIFFFLKFFNVESGEKTTGAGLFATTFAISLCLQAFLKMAPDKKMKSVTYKIVLIITLFCGYITFSYYESVFASTLIVESEVLPYKSWNDVAESDKLLFVLRGTINEDMFMNAPIDHPMRRIFEEKIKVVPEELSFNKIGRKGSIPYIISDEFLAFSNVEAYDKFKEFPCQIIALEAATEITYASELYLRLINIIVIH